MLDSSIQSKTVPTKKLMPQSVRTWRGTDSMRFIAQVDTGRNILGGASSVDGWVGGYEHPMLQCVRSWRGTDSMRFVAQEKCRQEHNWQM